MRKCLNDLEAKKIALGKLFLKHGLTPEVVKLSQEVDELVAMEQRRKLEAC